MVWERYDALFDVENPNILGVVVHVFFTSQTVFHSGAWFLPEAWTVSFVLLVNVWFMFLRFVGNVGKSGEVGRQGSQLHNSLYWNIGEREGEKTFKNSASLWCHNRPLHHRTNQKLRFTSYTPWNCSIQYIWKRMETCLKRLVIQVSIFRVHF